LRRKNVSIKGEPLIETQASNKCLQRETEEAYDDLETATEKCFACNDFGKEEDLWYKCTGCRIWVHEDYSEWYS
jgi:hypothetical protein